jgi:hypothetical protein
MISLFIITQGTEAAQARRFSLDSMYHSHQTLGRSGF